MTVSTSDVKYWDLKIFLCSGNLETNIRLL